MYRRGPQPSVSERHEHCEYNGLPFDLYGYQFNIYTEVYRRGHNGPDSKSGIRQRIVGSNPTASATEKEHLFGVPFFVLRKIMRGFERVGIGNLKSLNFSY